MVLETAIFATSNYNAYLYLPPSRLPTPNKPNQTNTHLWMKRDLLKKEKKSDPSFTLSFLIFTRVHPVFRTAVQYYF